MSFNISNWATATGRVGRQAYLIASGQNPKPVPFSELAGYAYLNPEWLAPLAQSYDALLRNDAAAMSLWQQTATTILLGMVSAQNPVAGQQLSTALSYLYNQFVAQAATVKACTIGSSVTANGTNVGTGVPAVTTFRGDGLIQQNAIAETGQLAITADSYTGGATRGQEPWRWQGQPNVSSLGTGTPVGLWDFDYPQGSATSATGNAISSTQYGQATGNYLTNGDFAGWTGGGTPILNNWHLVTGTWGTDVQQGVANGITGGFSLEFISGTGVLTALSQQFNSSVSDGTNAAAGTPANPASPTASLPGLYTESIWMKSPGTITGGVLTWELTDGSGTVVNDAQGNPNSGTITLNTVTGSYVEHQITWRLPTNPPAALQKRFKIMTALTGAHLLLAANAFSAPRNLYPGGPSLAVFSNPATPFVATAPGDGWAVAFSNDRGGSTFLATFQALVNRLWGAPTLLLPYTGSPTISDALITGV